MTGTDEHRGMTALERRSAFSLAGIFSLRMLGLFMIYPVFSVFALKHLAHATPTLVGVALGAYGLTQALFQIPFGMLSDRIGRKPVIAMGLLLFAAGSLVAALSHSIEGVILGRILQGAGAIGSTVLALAADLTREEHRTKAMATIGMTIGFSFALAVVLGPLFDTWIGVPGIFGLTALLAASGLLVLRFLVPNPVRSRFHRDTEPVPALFRRVLTDGQLLRLDFGIMALHLILTALFVALPLALKESAGLDSRHQWFLYLPVLAAAVVLMVPFIIIAEKRHRMKQVFIGAILALALAGALLMTWHARLLVVAPALVIFFTAFTLMEASLPSLISKMAPPECKGTAMGVYSSSQFFGIFIGGAAGGWVQGHYGIDGVFAFVVLVALLWFLLALSMRQPRYLNSHLLAIGEMDRAAAERLAGRLSQVPGVAEVAVVAEEGVAYLKVDPQRFDAAAVQALVPAAESA